MVVLVVAGWPFVVIPKTLIPQALKSIAQVVLVRRIPKPTLETLIPKILKSIVQELLARRMPKPQTLKPESPSCRWSWQVASLNPKP